MNEQDKTALQNAWEEHRPWVGADDSLFKAAFIAGMAHRDSQAQAEPVAWLIPGGVTTWKELAGVNGGNSIPLYTHPPAVAQDPVGHFVLNKENGHWMQLDKQAWPNGSFISEALYKQPTAVAVDEQMLEALIKTKAWFDAEENHDLVPSFYDRAAMCVEAEGLISKAIAAAEQLKEQGK